MKKTVFIIHGTMGNPQGNWFPWLKQELEKVEAEVIVPQFPTPENQSFNSWIEVMQPYFDKIDENTIFVGHSLGPSFILSILELVEKVDSAFFVAGFVGDLGIEKFDALNSSFVNRAFDWDKIKQTCENFYVINSEDDPYVPQIKGEELAQKLGIQAQIVEGLGHINAEFGVTELPVLLEKIMDRVFD